MTPKVSVVMATYNGQKFIKEAIDSILNQTLKEFEFIIVDDGSTDATAQIIQSYTDERIQYIKKEKNSGISDSLNIGISKARAQYIARMDDDDVSMPNRLEKQVNLMKNNERVIFCGSTVTDKDSKTLPTPEHHEDILLKLLFSNPIFHPTVMIRRNLLLENTYSSVAVPSEDYDLWSRLIFKGEFYQIQEPLLYCRIHQTSITARKRHVQLQKNIVIVSELFDKLGFNNLHEHDKNLKVFTSHDYTISGKSLKSVFKWIKELKDTNTETKKFNVSKFNNLADYHIEKFLTSYFLNRKLQQKIVPFLYLNDKYKSKIINFYLKK